jgi:hypothetical protein
VWDAGLAQSPTGTNRTIVDALPYKNTSFGTHLRAPTDDRSDTLIGGDVRAQLLFQIDP